MAVIKPVVHSVVLANGALTKDVDMRQGLDDGRVNAIPENIMLIVQGNAALAGTEVVDIYGYAPGNTTIITAVVATQLTIAASNVVRVNITSTALGCWKLRFIADALDAGEEVAISVLCW